jgi:hypothetical protein
MKNISIFILIIFTPIFIGLYYFYGTLFSPLGLFSLVAIVFSLVAIFFIPKKENRNLDAQVSPSIKTVSKRILYVWPLYTFVTVLFISLIIGGLLVLYTILFPGEGEYSGGFATMLVIYVSMIWSSVALIGSTILSFLVALVYYFIKK